MSRRRRTRNVSKAAAQVQKQTARDGFINTLAYLGEASELTEANDYQRHSITQNYELLTTMYRENWIAKKIIDTPAEDMTRAWYEISSATDQDKIDELAKLEAKHNVKQEITNAIRWARLYGGAAAVIVIKGQEEMLDQPLDFDMLMPGCFRGLIIVDRTDGLYPSVELEEDMNDPEFGYPLYYTVNLNTGSNEIVKIHHSRLLLFRGRILPVQEEINENYWGASELEHIYEELQKRNATSANIAQLVFQANVVALKMGDYGEIIGMGTDAQKARIYEAIQTQNRIRNSFGMMLMSSEDQYEQHPYSFSGMAEVYELFMLDMAGAAEIPATKLYGRAPQGMNATGESDMKNYYEMISGLQERILRPAIEKLLPVMAMSIWGEVPDDMEVVFEPLETTTPAERATISQQQAGSIIQAFSAGLITQQMALKELRETGKPIGSWTVITDEDIEKADNEFDSGEGMEDPMGMMGGGMMPEGSQGGPEQPPEPPDGEQSAEEMKALEEAVGAEEEAPEAAHDGGPGSGPRPGYKKGGSGLIERARFMANPTAGMSEPQRTHTGPTGSKAQVEKQNREREEWANLSMKQKVKGNAEQEKHIRQVKAEVMKAAAKGDLEKARSIVKENRHYWSNDPDSAQKVQSETLKRQKAVKDEPQQEKRGFVRDALAAIARFFGRDKGEFDEEDHPRAKNGRFAPKGSGSAGGESESESAKPVDFTEISAKPEKPKAQLKEPEEKPQDQQEEEKGENTVANGPETAHNSGGTKPTFNKVTPSEFRATFHAAKAEVEKIRPQDAWRVDSTYSEEDYKDMECFTTPGGSSVAVHDGDIVSVCKNPKDKTVRGSDLLKHAVEMGGNKLDAFGELYGFYIRCGFEPVSWCKWDQKNAPPDWNAEYGEEPVIFYRHTGRTREEIERDFGERYEDFTKRVKPDAGYGEAQKRRDDVLRGQNK